MGTQTGLHPLLALIGIYVGIQFSGLWGALLGPLVMILILSVIRSGVLDNTFRDFKEVYYKTAILLKRD
jgi:Predicted permease